MQPYPPNGSKWQVSNAGGVEPQWRGDGKELFYYSGTGIMSVGIDAKGGAFEAGLPKPVLEVELGFQTRNRWVVTKDGQKFLAIVPGKMPWRHSMWWSTGRHCWRKGDWFQGIAE